MKKAQVCFLMLLLGVSSFSGCSTKEKPNNGAVGTESVEQHQQTYNLQMETPYNGLGFQVFSGNDDGYYECEPSEDGSVQIVYTDYETKYRVYLSNQLHPTNDETNPGWIDNIGGGAFPFVTDNYIYVFAAGTPEFSTGVDVKCIPTFYRMTLAGKDRVKVEVPDRYYIRFDSAVVSNADSLYFLAEEYDEGGIKSDLALFTADFSKGELEKLCSLGNDVSANIVGAYSDKIVLRYTQAADEGDGYRICLYSMQENTVSDSRFDWKMGDQTQVINGKDLYYCDFKIGGEIRRFDLESGDDSVILSDWGERSEYNTVIEGYYDNHLIVSLNNSEFVEQERVGIDGNGTITPLSLKFSFGEKEKDIKVYIESKEYFVVGHDTEIVHDSYSQDGNVVYFDREYQIYDIIKKSDYWAGIPNYIEIGGILSKN